MADLQILIPCFECGLLIFNEAEWTWATLPDVNGFGAVRYYHDYGECAAKRKEALDAGLVELGEAAQPTPEEL